MPITRVMAQEKLWGGTVHRMRESQTGTPGSLEDSYASLLARNRCGHGRGRHLHVGLDLALLELDFSASKLQGCVGRERVGLFHEMAYRGHCNGSEIQKNAVFALEKSAGGCTGANVC